MFFVVDFSSEDSADWWKRGWRQHSMPSFIFLPSEFSSEFLIGKPMNYDQIGLKATTSAYTVPAMNVENDNCMYSLNAFLKLTGNICTV